MRTWLLLLLLHEATATCKHSSSAVLITVVVTAIILEVTVVLGVAGRGIRRLLQTSARIMPKALSHPVARYDRLHAIWQCHNPTSPLCICKHDRCPHAVLKS